MKLPQFSIEDVMDLRSDDDDEDDFDSHPYHFGEDLSEFSLFKRLDNHDIARKLKNAGVINDTCVEDSEMGEFVCVFKKKKDARAFIVRLNKYLKRRHKEKTSLLEKLKNLP